MIKRITINEYFDLRSSIPLLDVRAPLEYLKGHIPGAHSLPIFTDEERAKVGITYKEKGREAAILLGFDLVGTKWRGFIEKALILAPDKIVYVHCWRGGMRSEAMAWALDFYGFEVVILEGGYKAYRNWALNQFEQEYSLWVLGGMTGSHKTDILKALQIKGEQTIDLEGLANHQGSAFGSMGKWIQPTQEQFENELALILIGLDKDRKIWVEDESRTIGKIAVPTALWQQMQIKSLIELQIQKESRLEYLTIEYGSLDKDFLINKTEQIRKRLGFDLAQKAVVAIQEDRMKDFVEIVLAYYDKSYQVCISKRHPNSVFPINLIYKNPQSSAEQILDFVINIKSENNKMEINGA